MIERALAATREHFDISHDAGPSWINSHRYQYANRLAHLCFFERLGVPVRLAHVYFTRDTSYISTTSAEFDEQRQADADAMGLSAASIASATGVYLSARPDAYAKLRGLVA